MSELTLEVRDKISINYGKDDTSNKLLHVVAIVDEDQVVVKHYSKHKKRWIYEVKPQLWFTVIKEYIQIYKGANNE